MKKRSLIFILALAIFTMASCQQEPEGPLSGTWDISWEDEHGILYGDIEFKSETALLKAYGEDHSPFLKDYEEKYYTWEFRDGVLLLFPGDKSVGLRYQLKHRADRYLEFSHLEDIKVVLQKRHP